MFFEYREYKECKIKEHNIVWSHDKKLKWNNFIYRKSPEKSLFIDVTFLSRFENTLDNTTSITTYSVFNPKKSIISDTTDTYNLRIAQAKFDLLESHRRKMQKHFDSITLKSSETINDKLFKKIIYFVRLNLFD